MNQQLTFAPLLDRLTREVAAERLADLHQHAKAITVEAPASAQPDPFPLGFTPCRNGGVTWQNHNFRRGTTCEQCGYVLPINSFNMKPATT